MPGIKASTRSLTSCEEVSDTGDSGASCVEWKRAMALDFASGETVVELAVGKPPEAPGEK